MTVEHEQPELGMRPCVTRTDGPSQFAHMRGAPEFVELSDTANDPELARRLWALSEELTDVRSPI